MTILCTNPLIHIQSTSVNSQYYSQNEYITGPTVWSKQNNQYSHNNHPRRLRGNRQITYKPVHISLCVLVKKRNQKSLDHIFHISIIQSTQIHGRQLLLTIIANISYSLFLKFCTKTDMTDKSFLKTSTGKSVTADIPL